MDISPNDAPADIEPPPAHRPAPPTPTRKWVLTPERRAYILEHYQPSKRGISYRIAHAIGVPKYVVCRWAVELGRSGPSTKGPAWTPADDAFVEANVGSRTIGWIARRLDRTPNAIVVRSKRLHISRRDARAWYTATAAAVGFGVDASTVTRWIARGWLDARHRGKDYPNGKAAAWRIEPAALRRFAQRHPSKYSLAKVDQYFFLDLVFGSIGDPAVRPAPRPAGVDAEDA